MGKTYFFSRLLKRNAIFFFLLFLFIEWRGQSMQGCENGLVTEMEGEESNRPTDKPTTMKTTFLWQFSHLSDQTYSFTRRRFDRSGNLRTCWQIKVKKETAFLFYYFAFIFFLGEFIHSFIHRKKVVDEVNKREYNRPAMLTCFGLVKKWSRPTTQWKRLSLDRFFKFFA